MIFSSLFIPVTFHCICCEGRTQYVSDSATECVKLVAPLNGTVEFLAYNGDLFRNFGIHLRGKTVMDSTLVVAQTCLQGFTRFLKRCVSDVLAVEDWLRKNQRWTRGHSSQQDPAVLQPRIHTGFHRFTEIGQSFYNKYILIKKNSRLKSRDEIIRRFASLHPRRMETGQYYISHDPETQARGLYGVTIQEISQGSMIRDLHRSLPLWRSLRKSVNIYPRSPPDLMRAYV